MAVCEIQANAQLNINALQSLECLLFLNLTEGWLRGAALPTNLTEYCSKQMLRFITLSSSMCLDMASCESGNEATRRVVDTLLCNMKAHHPGVDVSKAWSPP